MIKRLMTAFLCILAAGLVYATGATSDTRVIGRTCVNEEYGFEISLPDENDFANWNIIEETVSGALVFFMGPWDASVRFQPKVNVYADTLAQPETAKEYLERNIKGLKVVIMGWKETSRRPIKVGGTDGYEVVYSGRLAGRDLVWLQHYLVRGQYAYVITGADVSEKFQPQVFRRVMNTFQFLPAAVKIPRGKLTTTWGNVKAR